MPHEINKEMENFLYKFESYVQNLSDEEFYDAKQVNIQQLEKNP